MFKKLCISKINDDVFLATAEGHICVLQNDKVLRYGRIIDNGVVYDIFTDKEIEEFVKDVKEFIERNKNKLA